MPDTLATGIGVGGAIDAFGNTHVSFPGGLAGQSAVTAPGASGPGSSMGVDRAALLIIGTSLAVLLVMGYVFRKG